MDRYTDILHRCIKRDRRAQMEFYTLFCRGVYNSCFRILNNPMDAEEVMQETFIKFFDHVQDYVLPYPDLERKLRRMAINASIDVIRRRRVLLVPIDDNLDCAEDVYGEEEEADISVEQIQQAIAQLPDGYRTIVNLRLIEEFSFEHIAQILGIAPSTARSQFVRARKKLEILIKKLVV